jgi:hypothetical protein
MRLKSAGKGRIRVTFRPGSAMELSGPSNYVIPFTLRLSMLLSNSVLGGAKDGWSAVE